MTFRTGYIGVIMLCLFLATGSSAAEGQQTEGNLDFTGVKVGVIVGSIAAGVGIGAGVYLIARHNGRFLEGCGVLGAGGMRLQTKDAGKTYLLLGNVTDIKPAERVRVYGRKQKRDSAGEQSFLVERIGKNYGACQVHASAP